MRTEDELNVEIGDAQRVEGFLSDPAVKRAFARLAAGYYDEFKKGESPESRVSAWAKSRALEDLQTALAAVESAGTRAKAERVKVQEVTARNAQRAR